MRTLFQNQSEINIALYPPQSISTLTPLWLIFLIPHTGWQPEDTQDKLDKNELQGIEILGEIFAVKYIIHYL